MITAIKRAIIVIIGVLLQFGFAISIQLFFREHIAIIGIIYELLSVLIVLKILKDSTRISNDLPWIILILLFPIFGTILLITLSSNYARSKLLKNIFKSEKKYQQYLNQDIKIRKEIDENDLDNLKYIIDRSKYPVTKNNKITYYDYGEKFY